MAKTRPLPPLANLGPVPAFENSRKYRAKSAPAVRPLGKIKTNPLVMLRDLDGEIPSPGAIMTGFGIPESVRNGFKEFCGRNKPRKRLAREFRDQLRSVKADL